MRTTHRCSQLVRYVETDTHREVMQQNRQGRVVLVHSGSHKKSEQHCQEHNRNGASHCNCHMSVKKTGRRNISVGVIFGALHDNEHVSKCVEKIQRVRGWVSMLTRCKIYFGFGGNRLR